MQSKMKSSINLLPNEYALVEKHKKRFNLVQSISMLVMLFLFFIGSLVVALKIIQSKDISFAKKNVEKLEAQISQFKDKEASLFVLKNRLNTISRLLALPSKQLLTYTYAEENLPTDISITSITSDRSGDLILSMLVPDTSVLERVMDILTNQAAFELLKQVDIDNLARGNDGIYRVNLKMVPK